MSKPVVLTKLLLLFGIQPPLTTSPFWRLVEAAVLVGHAPVPSQTGWHTKPFDVKRLLLLVPTLLFSQWLQNPPANAGDLGVADMREVVLQQDAPPIFQGRCGGPLSDTIKKCRIAFINGKLVVSRKTKASEEPENDFNETRGITPDQVKGISWNEPQFYKHQRFTNEIIYISSEGKWTRAGFQFAHGDQVKSFYTELLRWMNQTSRP